MKNPEKLFRLDIALQLALLFGVGFTFFTDNSDGFAYCFFGFALIQVITALFASSKFNDSRKKKYLLALLFINGFGTLLTFIFIMVKLEVIAIYLFGFCWIICPPFLAIWAFKNSYLAWKEA